MQPKVIFSASYDGDKVNLFDYTEEDNDFDSDFEIVNDDSENKDD